MGSKLKKDRAKKRKLDEEPRKVEISAPKKKCEQEEEAATSSDDRQREILPTREAVARQVSVYVQQKELTLIEGPIGCGKSFLGAHIAEKLLLKLRCMQMGDQVDSKSIFGSYHCTEVAGQFQWKQSNLTQWLTEPSLILLEDIDLANSEVITIFREITKSRRILLPSGESVPFHEKARILATTSGKGKKNSLLEKICRVQLDALSDKELERLVLQSFPRCSDLRKTLIAIFRTIEAVPATGNSRSLTSSDFLRACSRLNRLANHSEPLHLFAELVDCWALSELPDRALVLCEKIAGRLSVTPDQVSSHLKMRQPSFSHDDYHCQIGRCRLPRAHSLKVMLHHKLGHTRDVLQLMERIAVCVRETESVLLVGETGVGKTSVVQDLASKLNVTLKVVNLSPTSDSDELLEGYKPTSIGTLMEPFTKFYHEVFTASLNAQQNGKFLDSLESCLNTGRYRDYLSLAEKTALKVLMGKGEIDPRWAEVVVRARKIRDGIEKNAVPFAITRGAVLEAVQNGYWLLVDEINLAPPECLDAIVHAISSPDAHPNFRLFACMNPATDAGKRRLPTSVRTRFTEFYVSEMSDPYQLALVVNAYMPSMKDTAVERLVSFYLLAKKEYPSSYSLRTFCRALLFAADDRFGSEERNVYEAVSMAFLTNLDSDEKIKMKTKIQQTFKVATTVALPEPTSTSPEQRFVKVEGYWIECGTVLPKVEESYVLTKTVKENLAEIARIISSGRFPVLLEGETSAGKTAIVTYLGRATGNEVIRINNHEHTDIQEYMGSYVAGEEGRLVFAEGALVKAVRNGSWVILDELNLAPTDVIESLNRLLDDNRELFIPELNKTIKAHPRFRLFATQNPAGTYSGRKKLSRALLSRFVVLKFHHLPMNELAQMVEKRCKIHLSAAEKMISVLVELRNKRSLSGLFSARDGLMTLRDVFRWARRLSDDPQQDWLQVLVDHGYFLLAGRCRDKKDELTVSETLEKVLKRKIEPEALYAETSPYFPVNIDTQKIVLTYGMRRMLVLTEQAWKHNEAVLMVGETGGGKTSLAETMGRGGLLTINCHERTETADLLGRLRPRDGGGFEWSDGVVISAMKAGAPLLVDEISLAEDSVLERLNPLFEEDRSLLLSDAGVEVHSVQAQAGYQMIATMNPGGDYGKKELSKALRNRFTEVWSSSEYKKSELVSIFDNRLREIEAAATLPRPTEAAQVVIDWIGEFFSKYAHVFRHAPSVRDIVACADLFGSMLSNSLPVSSAVKEALCAVFLDALESLPTRMAIDSEGILDDADRILNRLLGTQTPSDKVVEKRQVQLHEDRITIGWISVPFGTVQPTRPKAFSLKAPTCVTNFYRIARGLLINKPILLEGPPGCGKSSTVMAMAQLTGNAITRLNLSDQTDLSDLFGSDVPVVLEDGSISFRWEDGPVLRAIKRGEWILLDEMNLASQSVLEGLNACFDHRRVLYIAELNKSFEIPADSRCRFFACQNPRAQGGNRRALPKSFVNRFTSIWVDDLTKDDITFILLEVDEKKVLSHTQIHAMVEITYRLSQEHHLHGGPFTFNLRDLLRWLQLYSETNNMSAAYHLLFVSRMRREEDRVKLADMYLELFLEPCISPPASLFADSDRVMIGAVTLPRNAAATSTSSSCLFTSQTPLMTKLAACVRMHWLALVVGPRGCGKQTTIENLAQICGVRLEKISLTAETDAQELIGSYEQVIDETALSRAKAEITNALQGKIDEATIKKLRYAEELLELEIATELTMSQVKEDQYLVEKCRLEIQQAARADMRFSWIDSAFVKAFLEGHWLVIENVNMCSAAVLDRLNSCLENEGKLVISERQASFEPLEPHPNFRVFLTMDAKDGEISRAMRNRSVEIYMDDLWSTTECDSTTLATLAGQEIPKQISEALIHYPAETQLQFCILLREMRVEEACRQLNIHFEEEIESKEQLICCPRVSELQTDEFLKWILRQWRPEHGDLINRAFLCTLAASTKMLASDTYRSCFRDIGNRFAARLAGLCLPDSSIPIDSRFLGRRVAADGAEAVALRKIVDMTVAEWALTAVLSVRREDGSAEHLGQTLRKYELMHHPRSFRNIDYLANFAEAVQDCLKSGIFGPESRVYLFCLSLLLLVKTIRTELTDRAGGAPVYLAYNYLESIEGVEFTSGQMLEKLLHDVGQFWKAEAHQQFIKNYMSLYEQHRLVNAFETEEDCQRLKSAVAPYETEEYEPMEEEPIQESAIVSSLKLAKKAELILASLKCLTIDKTDSIFTAQKPLLMLNWTDPLYQHNSHLLALLTAQIESGSSMPVLSLPKKGTFSFVYTSFWESLDFDVNMSSLTIRDLQDLTLNAFIEKMWRLAANGQLLDESVSETLAAVPRTLQGWATSDVPGWRGRLDCALEVMQMAMPPHLTIDPIIYEEEKVRYLTRKLELVDHQLQILSQWRREIAKQDPECDRDSAHPILATLYSTRAHLLEELDCCLTNEQPVYRQNARLYADLCSEMNDFYRVSQDVASKMTRDVEGADQIRLLHAQLSSFIVSVASFRQNILSKFTSFVDVSMAFLTAVEILLSAALELLSQLEVRERSLELHSSVFPVIYELRNSREGVVSSEILAWSCRDSSPMPLRLKAAVVSRRLLEQTDPTVDLEWARREWRKWYERNVAKKAEKEYVYRDKTEEEKDERELEEFFEAVKQEQEILPPEDVCQLLNAGAKQDRTREHEGKEAEARYSMALTWIRHLLTQLHQLGEKYRNSSISSDLLMAKWVSQREATPPGGVLDVYRSASIAEFRKAGRLLEALVTRVKEVQERWPEITTFKEILASVDQFLSSTITTTHRKMAVEMESVIANCEAWERNSDREHSLLKQLSPLRELLVEWKKMEIRSWSHLLDRTEGDAVLSAQLVAFPLFDALFLAQDDESQVNIVAMSADWLHNGTLLDFPARLRSVKTLSEWAGMLDKKPLSYELMSLTAHFEQYAPLVEKNFKEQRSVAEQSLNDYIRIVKFNDLNLENIQAQSAKSHAHLFKIIKKFKANTLTEASTNFDTLLDIEKWTNVAEIEKELVAEGEGQKRVKRAKELSEALIGKAVEVADLTPIRELTEQAEGCNEQLRTNVNYDQYTEDEEKEKAQGYARNCRQRDVAMLIKEAQAVGLNARRAVTLNQEKLTQQSITGVRVQSHQEALIRVCSGGRNVCIKRANQVNQQLSVATRKHFSGLIEYGMSWMLKVHWRLDSSTAQLEHLDAMVVALDRVDKNVQADWSIDHDQMKDRLHLAAERASELVSAVEAMKTRIDLVPQSEDQVDATVSQHLHPLSLLHSAHPAVEDLKKNTSHAYELAKLISGAMEQLEKSAVGGAFERAAFGEVETRLAMDSSDLLNTLAELKEWFAEETAQSEQLVEAVKQHFEVKNIETAAKEVPTEPILLLIQSLYKAVAEKNDWEELRLIDRFDAVSQLLCSGKLEEVIWWLQSVVSDALVGILPSNLSELVPLASIASQLVAKLFAHSSSVLQSVAVLYNRLLAVTQQLFEKGYVNTIPKEGKQESGDGHTDEVGEGGGMGEGKAGGEAKDVTEEMEETGQIEGLQDEEQEPPSGDKGQNEKPIEMDEDFAEDLQDIDKEEKGNDEPEEEDQEDEEPNPEDQMGDVDEADDTQLDPKLWDEEEKDDERKETDQDDAGADNKTDEMAAKEDDPLAAQQQEKPDDQPAPGEEEKEEEELENVDEREREGQEDETKGEEIDKDQMDQNDEGGDEINMDEQMDVDETDKEDEEEQVDGKAEDDAEEVETEEDKADEAELNENPGEEEPHEEEDAEAMEQGTGGQRRDKDAEKNEGGANEDEEDEEQDEDEGKGESKSDQKGEKGQGAEAKEKEEAAEQDEEAEEEEQAQKERQLATEDEEVVEAEEGQGEENEVGQQMEDSAAAQRQMLGAGSMEEAKKSRKEEEQKKKEDLPKKRKPLPGGEEVMDVPAEEGDGVKEEAQAAIHLAPEDMFKLAEEITNELVLGEASTSSDEKSPSDEREEKKTSRADAEKMWTEICRSVNILSTELAENLRLILEPQRASKMQGDYRTGKRLNMRRLIPYIASEYRKDRIWMRRTKRAQRDYQVLIAVDDSASMNENGIHQVTCESVCAIDDALRRCDAGAVSVVSFGSQVKTICAFGDQITPGPEFIEKLSFDQSSTDLLALLSKSRHMLADVRTATSEQLLIIISDGRGALAQGAEKVKQAVAALQSVTVLFVILDSGTKSISELSVASFKSGSVVLTPYLSLFPFPFYAVVKSVRQLPSVLAESIRQWFELSVQSS